MSSLTFEVTEHQKGDGWEILQLKTADLAIFSYILLSEGSAVIVDPTINPEPFLKLIGEKGAKVQFVILTHYHADFVSGHTQFGTKVIMGPTAKRPINGFVVTEVQDNEDIAFGSVKLRVIHTPGHTPESSCYLLIDRHAQQHAIFTGDTVFLGDVGRPDLACSTENGDKEHLAKMLWNSLQKLKTSAINPEIRLYPGHGAGSSCGKSIGQGFFCTWQKQLEFNYGFTVTDQAEFIAKVTAIEKPPSYFFYDAKINQKGPHEFKAITATAHKNIGVEEFIGSLSKGVVLIDTRANPQRVLIGSYWLSGSGAINIWIGFVVQPEKPFIVIADPDKKEEILERLMRVSYNPVGLLDFNIDNDIPQLNTLQFLKPRILDAAEALKEPNRLHLDVRNPSEWTQTGVIDGSVLIPLPEFLDKALTVPAGNLYISCRSGLRARMAASILAAKGRTDVTIISDSNCVLFQKSKISKLWVTPLFPMFKPIDSIRINPTHLKQG